MASKKVFTDYEEQYRKLKFTNDFMFGKVMENNPDICRELLELLLNKDIGKVELQETQKAFSPSNGGRSIRLDVFLKDQEGTVYDIEMQTVNKYDILERSRYYRTVIDSSQLNPGDEYKKMKKTYMIFIFTFDLKNTEGLCIRSFQHRYDDPPHRALEDGFTGVFVNPWGTQDAENLSCELESFLEYVKTGKAGKGKLVQRIEEKVTEARKNILWGHEYMTFQVKMNEAIAEAVAEAVAEARAEARREGISLGEKQGISIGEIKAKTETAKAMKTDGLSFDKISKFTGLSLAEIETL